MNHSVDAETAVRRWADTWLRAWPQRDVEAIAAVHAEEAVYRSPAFGQALLLPGWVLRFDDEGRMVDHATMTTTPSGARHRTRAGRHRASPTMRGGVR